MGIVSDGPSDTDLTGFEVALDGLPPPPWHAGRTVGRTLYVGDGPDDCIGLLDSRHLSESLAYLRNQAPAILAEVQRQRAEIARMRQALLRAVSGSAVRAR